MYEKKKKKEKKYLETFSKRESNKRLINIVVIKTHSKRYTSKEILIRLY